MCISQEFFISGGDGLPRGVVENQVARVRQVVKLHSYEVSSVNSLGKEERKKLNSQVTIATSHWIVLGDVINQCHLNLLA